MHQATPINTLGGEQEQGSLSHQVKVWIDAASHQTLSNIQKVVYYLHPTFNPSEIASDNPSDNFAISLNVWGEFEIKATVFSKMEVRRVCQDIFCFLLVLHLPKIL